MKMLMEIKIPPEAFNQAVKDGTAGQKIGKILEHTKPEAAYWTTLDGHRGGVMVVNIDNPSQIPSLAEPWFLTFNAEVNLKPFMTTEDLQNAGLDEIGQSW